MKMDFLHYVRIITTILKHYIINMNILLIPLYQDKYKLFKFSNVPLYKALCDLVRMSNLVKIVGE